MHELNAPTTQLSTYQYFLNEHAAPHLNEGRHSFLE
jgi:hypothetical protein